MEPQREHEPDYFTPHERQTIARFFFQNAGGLLAVVGMIFSGGLFMAELRNVGDTAQAIQIQQAKTDLKLTDIDRAVAILQTQVAYIDGRERQAERRGANPDKRQ